MGCCCCETLVYLAGSAVILKYLFQLGTIVYQNFIQKPVDLKKYGANEGAWALVTGASDGIGRQFVLQLGKAGFNVLLVSRTKSKLDEVAKEVETQNPKIKTKVVSIDFANAGNDEFKALEDSTKDLDISVLVNNVGCNHSFPTPFAEEKPELLEAIINVNVKTTVKVTRMLLPQMIAKKRGLILNMGSFSGMLPTPLLTTYSGGKAFLSTWNKSLSSELEGTGVHTQLFNTYFVTTNMSKIRRATALIPNAEDYVKSAMAAIGKTNSSAPYFTHAVAEFAINLVPEVIAVKVNKSLNLDTRKRALRKQERLAKEAKKE